jgi:hypothetical protein
LGGCTCSAEWHNNNKHFFLYLCDFLCVRQSPQRAFRNQGHCACIGNCLGSTSGASAVIQYYAAARKPILHPKMVGSAALSTVFLDRSTLNVIVNGMRLHSAAEMSCANTLRPLTRSTVYRSRSGPSSFPDERAQQGVYGHFNGGQVGVGYGFKRRVIVSARDGNNVAVHATLFACILCDCIPPVHAKRVFTEFRANRVIRE